MNSQTVDTKTYHSFSGCDIKVYASVNTLAYQKLKDSYKAKADELNAEIASLTNSALALNAVSGLPGSLGVAEALGYSIKEQQKLINSMGNEITFVELGEIQTISYSVYRDKRGVNVLGRSAPKGFTRGFVTTAGTMIFTVLNERILHEIFSLSYNGSPNEVADLSLMRVDQLPPIDIFITFSNEYGDKSRISIYGVEFMNEGQVMSVNDLITENSVNYVAQHLSPMRKVTSDRPDHLDLRTGQLVHALNLTADDYNTAQSQLKAFKGRFL